MYLCVYVLCVCSCLYLFLYVSVLVCVLFLCLSVLWLSVLVSCTCVCMVWLCLGWLVLVGLSLCCALCGFPCGSLVCLSLCCMYLVCCTTSLVMWCCWIAYLGSATALQMNGDSVSVCHYINHLPSVGLSLAQALGVVNFAPVVGLWLVPSNMQRMKRIKTDSPQAQNLCYNANT